MKFGRLGGRSTLGRLEFLGHRGTFDWKIGQVT